jgi:hypothetical protein
MEDPPSGKQHDAEKIVRKTRTRSGCLNCRRRRRKCMPLSTRLKLKWTFADTQFAGDETRPSCIKCQQRHDICEWGLKLSFKAENATALRGDHPSMVETSRKTPRTFKVCILAHLKICTIRYFGVIASVIII